MGVVRGVRCAVSLWREAPDISPESCLSLWIAQPENTSKQSFPNTEVRVLFVPYFVPLFVPYIVPCFVLVFVPLFILYRIEVQKLSKQTHPCWRTTKQCAASGRRANGVSHEDEPYYDIDVFTRSFGVEFNVTAKTGYDIAHGLSNNIADLFHLVLNTGQILM